MLLRGESTLGELRRGQDREWWFLAGSSSVRRNEKILLAGIFALFRSLAGYYAISPRFGDVGQRFDLTAVDVGKS